MLDILHETSHQPGANLAGELSETTDFSYDYDNKNKKVSGSNYPKSQKSNLIGRPLQPTS